MEVMLNYQFLCIYHLTQVFKNSFVFLTLQVRVALRFTHESWFGYPITCNSTTKFVVWISNHRHFNHKFRQRPNLKLRFLTNQNLLFISFQNSIFNGRHCVTDALDILIQFMQSIRELICLSQVRLHVFLIYFIDYVKELENVLEIIKNISTPVKHVLSDLS